MKGACMMKTIRKHLFIITIIIVLIIIIGLLLLKLRLSENNCDDIHEESIVKAEMPEASSSPKCAIDIKGAVKNPGVYTTNCDQYVNDIIALAGGLTSEADTSTINLAKQVKDEMVIIINTKEEIINMESSDIVNQEIVNDSMVDNSLININAATLDELKTIPGIGDVRAKAIIEYRNNNGSFKDIKDITNVKGIGEALYEQIKVYITT